MLEYFIKHQIVPVTRKESLKSHLNDNSIQCYISWKNIPVKWSKCAKFPYAYTKFETQLALHIHKNSFHMAVTDLKKFFLTVEVTKP